MIDSELIKHTYSQLPDLKLIILLKEEGPSLTYDAFILLKREYLKRKLDPSIIRDAELLRLDHSKEKILNNFIKEGRIVNRILWLSVLKMKTEEKKDKEIIQWLISEGIPSDIATEAIAKLAIIVKEDYLFTRKKLFYNFLFLLAGIVLLWMAVMGAMVSTYLISGGIIVASSIKIFYDHNKIYRLCEKALDIIEAEKLEIIE